MRQTRLGTIIAEPMNQDSDYAAVAVVYCHKDEDSNSGHLTNDANTRDYVGKYKQQQLGTKNAHVAQNAEHITDRAMEGASGVYVLTAPNAS